MKFAIFTGLGGTAWEQVRQLWGHVEATGWDPRPLLDRFIGEIAPAFR